MTLPILYIKQGCPWCTDAMNYFEQINLKTEVVDVLQDSSKMKDLIECSGQSKTPTLKNGEFVIADFDTDEFNQAIEQNPQEAKKLGLQ